MINILITIWISLFPASGYPQNLLLYRSAGTLADTTTEKHILLADPTIFYEQGVYYLYGTHDVDRGFQVFTSADLINWRMQKELALDKKNAFGTTGFWAPQVFKYKSKYYMAYTADERIAIAVSNSPLGPFKQPVKKPLSDPGGLKNIDPFVFIDSDGKKYLYYVRLKQGNRIFMAELNDDLSDIKLSTVVPCIDAVTHPQKWENTENKEWTVTEGATVLKRDSVYYLFYSANDFTSHSYAVGYATAKTPAGPWIKYEKNPVLQRDMIGANGSGHGDFFVDKTGQFWYVFHTHFSNAQVAPRTTALIKANFVSEKPGPGSMEFLENSFFFLKQK